MPTRFGYVFGAMSFILLLMAIGYSNNVIYFYVFALIGVAMVSMFVTNQNVARCEIKAVQLPKLYANELITASLSIKNLGQSDSHFIELSFRGEKKEVSNLNKIKAKTERIAPVPFRPPQRGWNSLPKLELSSPFPFGLLRAWKLKLFNEEILVYPERKGVLEFPSASSLNDPTEKFGLFRDHRPYQSTDSPKHIDWKASSKGTDPYQKLLVKNFEGSEKPALMFDWEQTRDSGKFEDRLSQLSLWISKADEMGYEYSLSVAGFHTDSSSGSKHFEKCMKHLSLLREEDFI